jgi:hypothetical protein
MYYDLDVAMGTAARCSAGSQPPSSGREVRTKRATDTKCRFSTKAPFSEAPLVSDVLKVGVEFWRVSVRLVCTEVGRSAGAQEPRRAGDERRSHARRADRDGHRSWGSCAAQRRESGAPSSCWSRVSITAGVALDAVSAVLGRLPDAAGQSEGRSPAARSAELQSRVAGGDDSIAGVSWPARPVSGGTCPTTGPICGGEVWDAYRFGAANSWVEADRAACLMGIL